MMDVILDAIDCVKDTIDELRNKSLKQFLIKTAVAVTVVGGFVTWFIHALNA